MRLLTACAPGRSALVVDAHVKCVEWINIIRVEVEKSVAFPKNEQGLSM